MQKIFKFGALAFLLSFAMSACEKVGTLPYYAAASSFSMSTSTTTVAALPADSLKTVLTVNWTNPNYSVDSSTVKYVVEIDSTGRNFSKAVSKTVTGVLSTSFTAKELNGILLGFGFTIGTAYDMDVRVTASHANNNEQLKATSVKVKMTPYKIPPKVAPPTSGRLFLVGSATTGGWNNPVPVPTQEFSKIDSVTYAGVFDLSGGNEYLVLPVNGDWSNKYSVADKSVSGLNAGGNFGYNLSDNFPGPSTSGKYIITIDFQAGKFTVKPFANVVPSGLFLVGDATAGGWNNPVPVPSQQFTRVNSTQFELTTAITGGKQYLMLPVNGDWSNKFSVDDNSIASLKAGGTFKYNAAANFPGPDVTGNYKFVVNFANYTYSVTKQ